MKKKGQKERLKPISLYGLDTRDVIRAFMKVKPDQIKEAEEEEKRLNKHYDQDTKVE